MTAGGPPKEALAKFQTFQSVSAAGTIGIPNYNVKGENTLKCKVAGSGGANVVTVYGRIENESVYNVIGTVSGNTTQTFDISTVDWVRFSCTTYGGTPFELVVSGFYPAVAHTQPISGTFNISAPTGPFNISITTVNDAAADPLGASLADRVSLSIRNKSPTVTVYFGDSNTVTANDAATGGWEIGPGEDFNVDLNDSNIFYLITPAGQTAVVKILEIASV